MIEGKGVRIRPLGDAGSPTGEWRDFDAVVYVSMTMDEEKHLSFQEYMDDGRNALYPGTEDPADYDPVHAQAAGTLAIAAVLKETLDYIKLKFG